MIRAGGNPAATAIINGGLRCVAKPITTRPTPNKVSIPLDFAAKAQDISIAALGVGAKSY